MKAQRAGVRGKSRTNSPILGVDGKPVGHDPQILLPGGSLEPRPSALHLGVSPEGVVIAIRNGAQGVEDQDRITSTNLPWERMPSLINNLVRLMAFHFPRGEGDEGETEQGVEDAEILERPQA